MSPGANVLERSRTDIGSNARRPDAGLKVTGRYGFSSDMWANDMLWGATLRSPHPRARITHLETAAALTLAGVHAVLTFEDVPGNDLYGAEVRDQPVLASTAINYEGEPIAVVAADHPETARRALDRINIEYEVLEPLTDVEAAVAQDSVVRRLQVRTGNIEAALVNTAVTVTGQYEIGMQDQAFLGPESGLAVPREDGGIDLYVATQWLHNDLPQIADCLGLDHSKIHMTNVGVGGAFGGREDLSIQIHASMLALHTGRPVKMVYGRAESFFGHVHRHPARLHYEHGADQDGKLTFIKARMLLDGGAYTSSSGSVIVVATSFAAGPYEVPCVDIDGFALRTNNPPCGAMRGFGAVQACFGYESQMDKLAAALGLHPIDLRKRNAVKTGSCLATGQVIDGPAPVEEMLDRLRALPMPPPADPGAGVDLRHLPGGVGNTTRGEGLRRGVGYAVGIKSVSFSDGFDDHSTARVRLSVVNDQAQAEVHSAACENGQGIAVVQSQITRSELGVERVVLLPADTAVASAGSTAASRQTWLTGGAVKLACETVREALFQRTRDQYDLPGELLHIREDKIVAADDTPIATVVEVIGREPLEATRTYRPRATRKRDAFGQGPDAKLSYMFAAHRAVVDVDVDLGLVRVVDLAIVQDVGRAIHPQAVEGQMEGGTVQGMGLALMEEIQTRDGLIQNPSFTDYLIPTIADVPAIQTQILEYPQPHAPYGVNGVGEPPAISSTPAVAAALRDATGLDLSRVPVRPERLIVERAASS